MTDQLTSEIVKSGTGLKSTTKIYDLENMGQAIIWKLKDHEDRITKLEQNMPTIENVRQLASEIVKSETSKTIEEKFRKQDLKIQQQTEQLTNLTKAMYKLLDNLNKKEFYNNLFSQTDCYFVFNQSLYKVNHQSHIDLLLQLLAILYHLSHKTF